MKRGLPFDHPALDRAKRRSPDCERSFMAPATTSATSRAGLACRGIAFALDYRWISTGYDMWPPGAGSDEDASSLDLLGIKLPRRGLLRDVSQEALDDLAGRVRSRKHASGTQLVMQDDADDALFILASGHAKVVLLGESGREVILARLQPGDFFGEMSLFDGSPRSASVMAIDQVTLLTATRAQFVAHMQRHPEVAFNILGELSRRLRRTNQAMVELLMHDVEARLVLTLERLARSEGEETGGGLLLRRGPTQQELAGMVGACRETINRIFTSLVERGLLHRRGQALLVTRRLLELSPAPA